MPSGSWGRGLGPQGRNLGLSGRGLGSRDPQERRPSGARRPSGPRRQRLHLEPDAVLRAQNELGLPPHLARSVHAQAEAQ